MKGRKKDQLEFVHTFNTEDLIPDSHPIRKIKIIADEALAGLKLKLEAAYSDKGRPSIPPETLMKANILMALFSIRSERQLAEQLQYNMLFRWFLDMSPSKPVFDHSVFAKNRERVLNNGLVRSFFYQIVEMAREEGYLSDEHFTVDGTLIEAWASLKSFKPKDASKRKKKQDGAGRNPDVNFHGQKRKNDTHCSTTDPEARLARKGNGKEAKLCYGGHMMMENRNGFCVETELTQATGTSERDAGIAMLKRLRKRKFSPLTLGADKGYHTRNFVRDVRQHNVIPHIATIDSRKTPGLDGRTIRSAGYKKSQRRRKKVEEFFGWAKTVGGIRKTRYCGKLNV